MKTYPYMPFFFQDWFADPRVQSLTYEEQGVYVALLGRLWESDDASLPDDDLYLSRILRVSKKKWKQIRSVLIDGPTAVISVDSGRLIQKRLTKEYQQVRSLSAKRGKAGSMGGQARHRASNGTANTEQNASRTGELPQQKPSNDKQNASFDSHTYTYTNTDTNVLEKDRRSGTDTPTDLTADRVTEFLSWFPGLHPLRDRLIRFPDRELRRTVGEELTACSVVHGMDNDLIGRALQEALDRRKPMAYALAILHTYRDQRWTSLADVGSAGTGPDRTAGGRAAQERDDDEDLARAAAAPVYPMPVTRRAPREEGLA